MLSKEFAGGILIMNRANSAVGSALDHRHVHFLGRGRRLSGFGDEEGTGQPC